MNQTNKFHKELSLNNEKKMIYLPNHTIASNDNMKFHLLMHLSP